MIDVERRAAVYVRHEYLASRQARNIELHLFEALGGLLHHANVVPAKQRLANRNLAHTLPLFLRARALRP
jgi:hypothetical protein